LIRAVLFDLDGTLLDTAPDLIGALNYLRESEGLASLEDEGYRHYVSRGALGLISAGMPESSKEVFEQRKTDFLNHYQQNIYKKTRAFDGVENLLSELDRRAVPWGIVTNKMEYLTFPLLKAANLLHRAACVICGDTLQHSKPHPAPVLLGCEVLGSNSGQTLMVGDDLRDIQAGSAAGTSTALAAYGYLDPAVVVEDLAGVFVLNQPADVLDLLKSELPDL
jgi:phosphoglycolate phosphatase